MMVSSCALSFEDETIMAKDMEENSEVIQSIQTIVIINK